MHHPVCLCFCCSRPRPPSCLTIQGTKSSSDTPQPNIIPIAHSDTNLSRIPLAQTRPFRRPDQDTDAFALLFSRDETRDSQDTMSDLPYSLWVFIIILSAAVGTTLAYAVWRIGFHGNTDIKGKYDLSDEQKEYLRSVRDLNKNTIMASHGIRYH